MNDIRTLSRATLPLLALFLASGCADTEFFGPDSSTPASGDAEPEDAPSWETIKPDASKDGRSTTFEGEPVVYAHTRDTLFSIAPKTFEVSEIAKFIWSGKKDQMTDIAVDKSGRIIGVSRGAVYRVDETTAECTQLATVRTHLVGLTFVQLDNDEEILIGIDGDRGQVFRLDPQTGEQDPIGSFGKGLTASGDIVSIKGFGTIATINRKGQKTDLLARIDVNTGRATIIGDTQVKDIWGIGYWGDKLYGFTAKGAFYLIDPATAHVTLSSTQSAAWWGAGVTTAAPVIN